MFILLNHVDTNTQRETGRTAQVNNIGAAKAVSDIIRTTLGPRSMLKMLLDPMGGIVMTNDGNCILREVDVSHPAAKSMIELSRAQDEEVGDGTTSVIVLSGEILSLALPMIERNFHPTVIVSGYSKALAKALDVLDVIARRGKNIIYIVITLINNIHFHVSYFIYLFVCFFYNFVGCIFKTITY